MPVDGMAMYADWASLTDDLSCLGERNQSVLAKLPQEDALKVSHAHLLLTMQILTGAYLLASFSILQVVCCVAKNVSGGMGTGQTSNPDPKPSQINKQQVTYIHI